VKAAAGWLESAVAFPVSRELYEVFYRDAIEDIAAFVSEHPIRVME
jgi:hypothetical protein